MDYILLDHKKIKIEKAKIYFGQVYPNIKLCAVNVDTKEEYEKLTESGGYHLFEGDFFRMPAISKNGEIAPLKITYIELLNLVNQPDFDLTEVADVISKDTALVINMLKKFKDYFYKGSYSHAWTERNKEMGQYCGYQISLCRQA